MSIATRIESIEEHIEQAYDELQGLGADLTNVDKNIENISMVLDDIYDSMPQVSGEGTSLTLDDTRVGKIKSTLKGNTSQDGTPTPTTPQPVNVVSGDNKIVVCGKNLLDLTGITARTVAAGITITPNFNGDLLQNIKISGTPTTTTWQSIKNFALEAGTYILSGINVTQTNKTGLGIGLYIDNARQWFITSNSPTYTFTLDETTTCQFVIWVQSVADYPTGDIYLTPMIRVSSETNDTYEPYQPNTYNIDLPVENLFDKNGNLSLNYRLTTSGENYMETGSYISEYIPIKSNTTYTKNSSIADAYHRVCFYSNNDTTSFISKSEDNTFTTPSNAKYLRFCGLQTELDTTQLEKGSKQNTFTPYGTTPIELCKIGNYKDYFYKGTGKNLLSIVPPTSSSMKKGITSTYDSATGEISFSGTTTESYPWLSDATLDNPIQIGTNLIFSTKETKSYQIIARLYDSNGGMDAVIISPNATSNTITTTREVTRIGILTNTNSGVTINDKLYLQLENGSTMTTFEPYGSKDKWCKYEAINKTVLNSSSYDGRGDLAEANTYRYYFKAPNALIVTSTTAVIPLYSNLGISISRERAYNGNIGVSYFSQANKMQFVFDETKSLSINDLKTWLDNNYFEVYYILAVPTSKLITYQPLIDQLNELEKAQSKENQTNISQVNNDLPFIISASALKEWSV